MYMIHGTITGTADLLFNQMVRSELDGIQGKARGNRTEQSYINEAAEKCPTDEDGNAYIPSWTFKKVLWTGAYKGKVKDGRANIGDTLIATVFVEGKIHLTPNIYDYIHQAPGRIPPKTGATRMIYRPAFRAGWIAEFHLVVLDNRVPSDSIRLSLEEAGIRGGIGAWRPEYGRFVVSAWEVSNEK